MDSAIKCLIYDYFAFRDFYSISDAFDPTNLVVRHEKRAFYLTTSLAKTIIHSNRDIKDVRVSLDVSQSFRSCLAVMLIQAPRL